MADDFDSRLREEAMLWLAARTHDGADFISSADLMDFHFEGQPFRLMDAQRGIRKPRQLSSALSIRTVYTPDDRARPYDDAVGSDGLLRYKWRGVDPDHAENRALRAARQQGSQLIWFFGVGTALYKPIYPIYILWEEPEHQQFVLDVAGVAKDLVSQESPLEERLRRYIIRETRQRLHQPVFRATVIRAYDRRCAVCAFHRIELLDAAHIVPDSEEGGIASVQNGLSLCKIHHAAYDSNILGITPKLIVEIRGDILRDEDGPMLRYGLQERHGHRLMSVPAIKAERPNPASLEQRYERFRAAS